MPISAASRSISLSDNIAEKMPNNKRYTLEEAAAKIVFRVDDLVATLPDVGIDLAAPGHEGGTLSEEEVARLDRLVKQIRRSYNAAI